MKNLVNKMFIVHNRIYIVMLLFAVGAFIIPRLPYVNLYLQYVMGILLWFVAVITVGLRSGDLIRISIMLFFIMILLTLFNDRQLAEYVGNGNYFILLTAIILMIRDEIR